MKKLLKWAIITFGIAALVRWWRGREAAGEGDAGTATFADEPSTDPADELRRKLAESRPDEPAAGDATADAETRAETSVDDRRAEVHAEGRAAIDEMQSSSDS